MPGCLTLTASRFCPPHQAGIYRQRDQRRGTAAQRGYDARHRRWRALVLTNDPLCVLCLAIGVDTVATVADHILPLRKGGDWSLENGRGLCVTCHNRRTAMESMGGRR